MSCNAFHPTPSTFSDRVLVVEDNTAIRELLCDALQTEGYSVTTAEDGAQALEILSTQLHPFLILLDLMLPKISGWDVIDAVRSETTVHRCRDVPIVVVSAAGEGARDAAERVEGYLPKPIQLIELFKLVEQFAVRTDLDN